MKIRMKKRGVCTILLFGLALCTLPADVLWRKAVTLYERNDDWVPGRMRIRTEELRKDGTVKSVEESVVALSVGRDGDVATEYVSVTKDGKDVTESRNRNPNRGDGGGGITTQASPFDPELSDNVKARRAPGTRTLEGREMAEYHFTLAREDEPDVIGTAWIDVRTGAPYRVSSTVDPLPRFVSSLEIRIDYEYTLDQKWYPVKITFQGAGTILFVKKAYRSTMRLSNHFRAPKTDTD
jgi:hypothetical protein